MQPKVSIVILNWNGKEDTLECLHSLQRSSYSNFTTIVVDNGSTDGSVPAIRKAFPDLVVIENRDNLGFTGGNNIGIRHALENGAEYVWLLNNDTIIEPDTLSNLVAKAETSPDIALLSPVIYFHDPPGQVQFCGSYIDWERKRIVKLEVGEPYPSNGVNVSLWGTAILIRRDVVERVGFLNDKYFAYHEDEEYCMRVARAGYRAIVVPEARVFHKNSRSTGSNDAPMQVFLRSRNLFFLWMDHLKGVERVFHIRRYLARIITYGGSLRGKNLPDSVEACLDGVWHAFRDAGGARNPKITMPIPLRRLFRFLFSWHPFLWASLLLGDYPGIASNIKRRMRVMKGTN